MTIAPSPEKESALAAMFREVNLPQLLVLFAMITAVIVPTLQSQNADRDKDKIADAKERAVMQMQISQMNTHLEKLDTRADAQSAISVQIATAQAESKTKTDNILQTMELMRQDVRALRPAR